METLENELTEAQLTGISILKESKFIQDYCITKIYKKEAGTSCTIEALLDKSSIIPFTNYMNQYFQKYNTQINENGNIRYFYNLNNKDTLNLILHHNQEWHKSIELDFFFE